MQLSRDELLRAYRTMRTIRDFEERLHAEFATGEIPGFVHLYAGEEASAVGVCMHLTDVDRMWALGAAGIAVGKMIDAVAASLADEPPSAAA